MGVRLFGWTAIRDLDRTGRGKRPGGIATTLAQLIKLQGELWTAHVAQDLADEAEKTLGLNTEPRQ